MRAGRERPGGRLMSHAPLPDQDDADNQEPWWLEQVVDAAAMAAIVVTLLWLLVRP